MSCHVSSLRLCGEKSVGFVWDLRVGLGWIGDGLDSVGCIVERFCELGVVGVPLLFAGDG